MRSFLTVLAVFFTTVFLAPTAFAGDLASYSADVETTSAKATTHAKVYGSHGKQRVESSAQGKSGVMIIRPDKKVMWMLMPEQNLYMEMPIQRRKDMPMQTQEPGVKFEKEFLGNDTVEGHPTKKYHLKVLRAGKMENSGFMWEATDLHNFPIKHQSEDKTVTSVMKNIKTGPVSASLFEIPAGYSKMDMPVGMGNMKMPGR